MAVAQVEKRLLGAWVSGDGKPEITTQEMLFAGHFMNFTE